MSITHTFVMILGQLLAVGNGILGEWVTMPANATGPLDSSAGLSSTGTDFVGYIASSAVTASNMIAAVVDALF